MNEKWKNINGNINLYADIDESDIHALLNEPKLHSVQLSKFINPNPETWSTLNIIFKNRPDVYLSLMWHNKASLNCFDLLSNLKKLKIKSFLATDLSKIGELENLTSLLIGETESKSVDISFIKNLKGLEVFSIDGMKKGVNNIGYLNNLKALNLRGIKLQDIDFVKNLQALQILKLMYGNIKDLTGIQSLTGLKYIGISRVRGINDFKAIDHLKALEFLHLEGLNYIEKLPEISAYSWLKKIKLENLANLQDITNLSRANKLVEFLFYFPNRLNKNQRDNLLKQSFEVISKLPCVKYTNLFTWSSYNKELALLVDNGVCEYRHSLSKWRQDSEGGWTL